jgi:hypothetical protein
MRIYDYQRFPQLAASWKPPLRGRNRMPSGLCLIQLARPTHFKRPKSLIHRFPEVLTCQPSFQRCCVSLCDSALTLATCLSDETDRMESINVCARFSPYLNASCSERFEPLLAWLRTQQRRRPIYFSALPLAPQTANHTACGVLCALTTTTRAGISGRSRGRSA